MPQEINVLKCVSCKTFQSQIVKKTRKWECKVCGTKQTIKKVYGQGSGKDCRLHTQKLNSLKGERDIITENQNETIETDVERQSTHLEQNSRFENTSFSGTKPSDSSKWAAYLDEGQSYSHPTKSWDLKKYTSQNDISSKITHSLNDKNGKISERHHKSLQIPFQQDDNKTKNNTVSPKEYQNVEIICNGISSQAFDNNVYNAYPKKKIKTLEKPYEPKYTGTKWEEYLKPDGCFGDSNTALNVLLTIPTAYNNKSTITHYDNKITKENTSLKPAESSPETKPSLKNKMIKNIKSSVPVSAVQLSKGNNKTIKKHQSNHLLSTPVFEQNLDLNNVDFLLEF